MSPERVGTLRDYADFLATDGVVRGLIGPREAPRLWTRHLLNCLVLGDLIDRGSTVCDVGTGAGLPGMVLAIAREDLDVVLVEPLLRRTSFLHEAVDRLGLANVEVVRARAEALHGRRTFDVVTSRAVAPMTRLLDWSMPLVGAHGSLVVLKGMSVSQELSEAAPTLAKWRCGDPEIHQLGVGVLEAPTHAVKVQWANPAEVGWPLVSPGASRNRGRRSRK